MKSEQLRNPRFSFLVFTLLIFVLGTTFSSRSAAQSAVTPSPGPSGTFVYISNFTSSDITGFTTDLNGKLSPIPGSPFANGASTTGLALADRNTLMVGSPTDISAWRIDRTTGSISKSSTASQGSNSRIGASIAANGSSAYVAAGTQGIFGYSISDGNLTALAGSPYALTDPCFQCSLDTVSMDKDGQFVYTATTGFRGSHGFRIFDRAADGTLSNSHRTQVNVGTLPPLVIAVHPNGRFVYEFRSSLDELVAWVIDPATGQTISSQSLTHPGGASAAAFTNDGRYMLVTNKHTASVSVFAIDDITGTPQEVAGSPFAAGQAPNGVAIDSSSRLAFVIHAGPRQFFNPVPELISYRFDSSTGTLTQADRLALSGDPWEVVAR
jgi:6-phosphogluconolactonase (cycloisomerase 2 family)